MPVKQDCPFCGADSDCIQVWGESTIGGWNRWMLCGECGAYFESEEPEMPGPEHQLACDIDIEGT